MAIQSVAIIGAGAAGAATAAALKAENIFKKIKVYERRSAAGGTWIYDADPKPLDIRPGDLPPVIDRRLDVPKELPATTPHDTRQRFEATPIYKKLTTNVPDIAMCFTDQAFPYGPFVPHWIPRQYIENYFAWHQLDSVDNLVLNTTVEDMTKLDGNRWKLTLRGFDRNSGLDRWYDETFDAVIIANGHYSVPFVPMVRGLSSYIDRRSIRVEHSKTYRTPSQYTGQKVLIIGNSASGHDIMTQLRESRLCQNPIYVSRRSRSRWDGDKPPEGIVWKPVISEFLSDGRIQFEDGTMLSNVDKVIYCTGYRASFPFWNSKGNGRPLWDYQCDILINNFQHTFTSDFPTLAFVGVPRVLTFRSFEYQAIAIARLWSGRNAMRLPAVDEQERWRVARQLLCQQAHKRFHQIEWDDGETMEWLRYLFEMAGLPELEGVGRCPPVLGPHTRWTIDHVKKYPDYGQKRVDDVDDTNEEWELVDLKDILHFI